MEIDYGQPGDYSDDGRRLGGMKLIKIFIRDTSVKMGVFSHSYWVGNFAIFRGKRQQKIIPTMESNNNSSLEFSKQ